MKKKDISMSWQLLAGLSVLFFSLNGIFNRVIMRNANSDPFAQTMVFAELVGLFAFTSALASIFLYTAYQLGHNASQLAPILASEAALTVLLAIVFLKERNNILQKMSGAIIVLIGIALLF
jgi:uncharacterized membrane protein